MNQIGEKFLAHRRGSEVVVDPADSFATALRNQATQKGDSNGGLPSVSSEEDEEPTNGIKHPPMPSLVTSAETTRLFDAFRKCLDLRDKYMQRSKQRLGDNPKDYDGHFKGISEDIADVSGVRPDAKNTPPPSTHNYEPWKIYPRPPPPHWHWADKKAISADRQHVQGDEEFQFEDYEIPGPHPWTFHLDDKGVYQVYDASQGH